MNQGAAALLMSVAMAGRLQMLEENWVYLHGLHADGAYEQGLLDRPIRRWRWVMVVRRWTWPVSWSNDIATFDLYNAFRGSAFKI